ncbi:Hypothetical_protein [Hexamita inflata]|uniref:Hypothetical_protein n=1 Tax=Hexamita inflata TaxID=28002 RepID=A0AA86TQN1_9EUKA|nr:Hypothetical protein HINF_LOCUS12736 [Hexamita inflata]
MLLFHFSHILGCDPGYTLNPSGDCVLCNFLYPNTVWDPLTSSCACPISTNTFAGTTQNCINCNALSLVPSLDFSTCVSCIQLFNVRQGLEFKNDTCQLLSGFAGQFSSRFTFNVNFPLTNCYKQSNVPDSNNIKCVPCSQRYNTHNSNQLVYTDSDPRCVCRASVGYAGNVNGCENCWAKQQVPGINLQQCVLCENKWSGSVFKQNLCTCQDGFAGYNNSLCEDCWGSGKVVADDGISCQVCAHGLKNGQCQKNNTEIIVIGVCGSAVICAVIAYVIVKIRRNKKRVQADTLVNGTETVNNVKTAVKAKDVKLDSV